MLRSVLLTSSVVLSAFALRYAFLLWTKASQEETNIKVIFFPDKGILSEKVSSTSADPTLQNLDKVINKRDCLHRSTSLIHLVSLLSSAKETIDVCLLIFTLPQLCDKLLEAKNRGVRIRVLVDKSMAYCSGSRIPKLISKNVDVLLRKSDCGMLHHKFVLVDANTTDANLATGSFNWTWEAVTVNDENVIITNHSQTVNCFRSEFEKLWFHWNELAFKL